VPVVVEFVSSLLDATPAKIATERTAAATPAAPRPPKPAPIAGLVCAEAALVVKRRATATAVKRVIRLSPNNKMSYYKLTYTFQVPLQM
jgi:hypothetical protein